MSFKKDSLTRLRTLDLMIARSGQGGRSTSRPGLAWPSALRPGGPCVSQQSLSRVRVRARLGRRAHHRAQPPPRHRVRLGLQPHRARHGLEHHGLELHPRPIQRLDHGLELHPRRSRHARAPKRVLQSLLLHVQPRLLHVLAPQRLASTGPNRRRRAQAGPTQRLTRGPGAAGGRCRRRCATRRTRPAAQSGARAARTRA